MKVKEKNKLGQYFTPAYIADFMVALATVGPEADVLEPSCGEGVFLDALHRQGYERVTGIEIDPDLPALRHAAQVRVGSFVSYAPGHGYDLIIGNPPYIRWKNLEAELKDELAGSALWNRYCNRLCDYSSVFILKAVELLRAGGELIFITPEYWLNTTHAATTRAYLLAHGVLEAVYLFGEAPFFAGASVSTVVFKYVKRRGSQPLAVVRCAEQRRWTPALLAALRRAEPLPGVSYFELPQFKGGESWVLQPAAEAAAFRHYERQCAPPASESGAQTSLFAPRTAYTCVGDLCHVANGMVSGLDAAFQLPNDLALNDLEAKFIITVAKAKHLAPFAPTGAVRYLLLPTGAVASEQELAAHYPAFFAHLAPYRTQLAARYAYPTPAAYWEWSFLRNHALLARPEPRLLVPCKERVTNKDYFRFAYAEAGIFATQDVTALVLKPGVRESLPYVLAMLNHPRVFAWLSANGVVKGGIVEFSEKPINSIPLRRIDWQVAREVALHAAITQTCAAVIADGTGRADLLAELHRMTENLLG